MKLKLCGEVFDSSLQTVLDVETSVQSLLDNYIQGVFTVSVEAFDNTHIKLRIYRSLTNPEGVNALNNQPDSFLQIDKAFIFPNLSYFPSWGGYFNVLSDCQNVLDEINDDRKFYGGTKLTTLKVQSTKDYVDVLMSK